MNAITRFASRWGREPAVALADAEATPDQAVSHLVGAPIASNESVQRYVHLDVGRQKRHGADTFRISTVNKIEKYFISQL